MFSSRRKTVTEIEKNQQQIFTTAEKISEALEKLSQPYNKMVRPIEGITGFNSYCMGLQSPNHLERKPSCIFLGSYSSGKTTAIRYLLNANVDELPELRVGPEPTTDIFHVLTYGDKQVTSGGVILMNDPSLGFQNFSTENKDMARHFRHTRLPNACLKGMDLIDTPGFLSGSNMSEARGYKLPKVATELGKLATRIYLIMDTSKVDVSPECKETMQMLRPCLSKMKIIFNKADSVDGVNLLRLYGAIMYLIGQAVAVPEVPRVFLCSLWEQKYQFTHFRELFDKDKLELLNDLKRLPSFHYPHILGNDIDRLNCILIYIVVVRQFRKVMPFFKKDRKKQEILTDFPTFYNDALRDCGVMQGDTVVYQTVLEAVKKLDVNNLPEGCVKKNIDQIRHILDNVVPAVLKNVNEILNTEMDDKIEGGVFSIVEASNKLIESENAQKFVLSQEDIERADEVFSRFTSVGGRVDASQIKQAMLESNLPQQTLANVWQLSTDKLDGRMDMYEWRVASFLISYILKGNSLPSTLPPSMLPSSMRSTPNHGLD